METMAKRKCRENAYILTYNITSYFLKTYILFTCRAISTLTNPKRGLVKKTTYQITIDV